VDLLTLQEIAERLNMPPSTVRYYKDQYQEFMPSVKAGRYPKYEPEAVEIIRFIAAATTANQQQQDIKELLSAKFALNIEENEKGQSVAATAATAATTQQQQHSSALTIYEAQICSLLEVIKERDEAVKRRDEIMLQLLRQLREKEAQLKYYQLPWWRKLF
jgi:DNA-binding transcriptional MerR regulator